MNQELFPNHISHIGDASLSPHINQENQLAYVEELYGSNRARPLLADGGSLGSRLGWWLRQSVIAQWLTRNDAYEFYILSGWLLVNHG